MKYSSRLSPRFMSRLNVLLAIYLVTSLLHFLHNGVFINDYPNMPDWLSPLKVYGTWIGITSIGLTGYILLHSGTTLAGLSTLAIYAIFGFGGLDHYFLAPFSAHTFTMNLTIALEVAAATGLIAVILPTLLSRVKAKRMPTKSLATARGGKVSVWAKPLRAASRGKNSIKINNIFYRTPRVFLRKSFRKNIRPLGEVSPKRLPCRPVQLRLD